jgi:hypothetical protein
MPDFAINDKGCIPTIDGSGGASAQTTASQLKLLPKTFQSASEKITCTAIPNRCPASLAAPQDATFASTTMTLTDSPSTQLILRSQIIANRSKMLATERF